MKVFLESVRILSAVKADGSVYVSYTSGSIKA